MGHSILTTIDMAKSVPPMTSITSLTTRHGQFALPIIHYLKPHQAQLFFWQDMLFNIPFVADWHKIGGHRQSLTDLGNQRKNNLCIDYDYKVGDKILVEKEGIFCKASI
jgi:hypothetical protein